MGSRAAPTLGSRNGGGEDGKHREARQHRIVEYLRLEKASKIIESNHSSPSDQEKEVGIGL